MKNPYTSTFTTGLLALDAMLKAPTSGRQRAFHTRKQLAYCQHAQCGAADVFEYPVPVTYKRTRKIALHPEFTA